MLKQLLVQTILLLSISCNFHCTVVVTGMNAGMQIALSRAWGLCIRTHSLELNKDLND